MAENELIQTPAAEPLQAVQVQNEITAELLDRSKKADEVSRKQAEQFLEDLRPYYADQTKPFIGLLGKMARSGQWEPPDSKKPLIWYVLEERFMNSPSEQERAIAGKLLSDLRKQDIEHFKIITEFTKDLVAAGLTKDVFDADKEVFPPTDSSLSIRGMVTHIENIQAVAKTVEGETK